MAEDELGKVFDKEAAPPSLMEAETYRRLLERLLRDGKGFGKTKPVAAYFMTNIKFDRTDEQGNLIDKEEIEIKPVYIIMDLKYLPDQYSQWVTVKDIMVQYMKRTLGINDINSPDFRGPEVWTAKPAVFEQDYLPRDLPPDPKNAAEGQKKEEENNIHIYDPNPLSHRLAITVDENFRMPTQWGDWPVEPGGAVAVAERDIPALAAALQSIRDGKSTIEDALYTKDKNGQTVAKFDVYGMSPRFLQHNYDPVPLRDDTMEILRPFLYPAPAAGAKPGDIKPA